MNALNRINVLIQQLEDLKPLSIENQNKLDKKFRLEFNYNTNHIEGSTLTYGETELLLIFDDTKGDHTLRELEEMKGSDVAFKLIQEMAADMERPLSEQYIKRLNEILLVRPFYKEAMTEDGQTTRRLIKVGDYKEMPNSVRLQNGEIFHYASPAETPSQMTDLVDWFREEESKKEFSPIELAALLHYKFVRIHPFDDGNGRISRLLMNYVLFRNNLPPVIIKSEDKKNYLSALNRADTGDIQSFVDYISSQLIWSLEMSIKAAKGESIDEPGDLDKKLKLLRQKLNIKSDKIRVTRTKEVLVRTMTETIAPMFIALDKKLSDLDVFFRNKSCLLSSDGNKMGNNLEESIRGYKDYIQRVSNNYGLRLVFVYELSGLRNGLNDKVFTCKVHIDFYVNTYEVSSIHFDTNISKLYDEAFSEEETKEIAEQLGTYLHDQIEKVL